MAIVITNDLISFLSKEKDHFLNRVLSIHLSENTSQSEIICPSNEDIAEAKVKFNSQIKKFSAKKFRAWNNFSKEKKEILTIKLIELIFQIAAGKIYTKIANPR